MPNLLSDLHVAVSGTCTEIRAAASCLSSLGAHVWMRSAREPEQDEQLWLGEFDRASGEMTVDLLIAEHEADVHGLRAPTIVYYAGSSTCSPEPRAALDGRALAARGGAAVAIGEAERPPLSVPDGCLEHMVGSHIAGAAIAALLDGTAEVEVAGVDVVAWSVAANANLYVHYGAQWHRAGRRANGCGGGYPYSLFDVADGQFCLIGRTAPDWDAMIRAIGSPTWAQQSRYQDLRAMGQDYPYEVDERLQPWLLNMSRADLVALAAEFGFPGGPVLRPNEVLSVPSIQSNWNALAAGGDKIRVPGPAFDTVTSPGDRQPKPLAQTLVLDLSWVWSGPAVGVALADLGATVVKVESSTRPDNSRLRGRPSGVAIPSEAPELELTPYFHALNRGKRSIGLNLRTPKGRQLLTELAGHADVIIENLSPGVMRRLGVAAHQVQERNPECVYISLRGYREHPATTGLRAYAPVLSGSAGIESLVGYEGESPTGMLTYGFSDANAASQGLLLALAGLYARQTRLNGTAITLSQLDAAIAANGLNLIREQQFGVSHSIQAFDDHEPVVSFEQLPYAPWTSTDLFTTVSTPWLGELSVSRLPWRQNGRLPAVSSAGPLLGANTTAELTGRLGVDATSIRSLRQSGAVE